MLLAHEWICILESVVAFVLVFYNLSKYKSEKVSWGLFIFVLINLALHISSFVVLPFDMMKVEFGDVEARKDLGEAGEYFIMLYWRLYYWVGFILSS